MPENEDEMTLSPHGTDGAEPYEPSNEAEPDDDWQGNGSASEAGSDSEEPTMPRPATGPRPPVRPLGSEERYADIPEWVSEFRRMYVEPKSGGGGRDRTPAPREQEPSAEETQARERGRAGRLLRGWRGGRSATPTSPPTSPPVEPEPGRAAPQATHRAPVSDDTWGRNEPHREWASPVAPVEPTTAAPEQSPSPEDLGPAAHEEPAADEHEHDGVEQLEPAEEQVWVPSEDAEDVPVEAMVADEDEASPAQDHEDRHDHGRVEQAVPVDEDVVPVAEPVWVPSEDSEDVPVEAMAAGEDETFLAPDHADHADHADHEGVEEAVPVDEAAPVDEDVVPVAEPVWVPSEDEEARAVDDDRADVGEGDEDLEEPATVDEDVVPAADDAWVPAEDDGDAPDGDQHVAAQGDEHVAAQGDEHVASQGDEHVASQGDETPPSLEEHDESADAGHDALPELAPGDDHDTPAETGQVDDVARDAEPESAAEPDQGDPVATAPEDAPEPDIEGAAPEPVAPAPSRPTTGGDVPVDPPAVIRPGADAATERRLADVPVAKATPRVASNPYGIPGADAPVTPPVARPVPPVRGAAPAAAGAPESPAPQPKYMEAIIPPLDEASWREEGAVAPPRRRPRPQPVAAEEKAAEDLAGPPAEDEAPRSRAEAREATRQEERGTRRIRRRLLLFIVVVLVVVVVVAVTASWMKANGVPLVAPTALDGWVTAMTGPPPGPPAL